MSTEDESPDRFDCPVCGDTFETEADRDDHLEQGHPD
jgi:C4-type Zn-finger protein